MTERPKRDFDFILHGLVQDAWQSLETEGPSDWYTRMRERFAELPVLKAKFERMDAVKRRRRLTDEEFAKYRKARDEIARIEKGPAAWDKVMSYVHWQAGGGHTSGKYAKLDKLPDPDNTVFEQPDDPDESREIDFEFCFDDEE